MESFLYIANHIFLPPKLPQSDDNQSDDHAQFLCITIHKYLKQYIAQHVSPHQSPRWNALLKMMENLFHPRSVSERQLQRSISEMKPGGLFDSHLMSMGVILNNSDPLFRYRGALYSSSERWRHTPPIREWGHPFRGL
jgi:Family of unknown function (DUF6606)